MKWPRLVRRSDEHGGDRRVRLAGRAGVRRRAGARARLRADRRLHALRDSRARRQDRRQAQPLTWVAWPVGFTCAALAYLLQWFCNTWDYPLNVGGRPMHPTLSFVPITFETLVLTTSTVAFVGFFVASGFPSCGIRCARSTASNAPRSTATGCASTRGIRRFESVRSADELLETAPLRVVHPGRVEE